MKIKKVGISVISLIFFMFVISNNIYAQTYSPKDTDISIDLDDSQWYIATRENLYNNTVLYKLGVSYDYFYNTMNDNLIYLYGLTSSNNEEDLMELLITKEKVDGINNFINFSKKDILKSAKKIIEGKDNSSYDIYENKYRFIQLSYTELDLYVEHYYTVINGEAYNIIFRKNYEFSDLDRIKLKEIVDTIEFEVNESLTETYVDSTIDWAEAIKHGLVVAASFVITTFIIRLINRNKSDVIESKISYLVLLLIVIAILKKICNI